jgi:predicted ribosome quality control (RQC) complex YloA/Tae2 family protein
MIRERSFSPCLILNGEESVEYSFMPLYQYGSYEKRDFSSAGKLLDTYFASRDNRQRVHQRASDILRLLTNAEGRIKKKLELQRAELKACDEGDNYRKYGDLITANIYKLQKKTAIAELEDWEQMDEDGNVPTIRIELDSRLTPAANAQRYYKKYAKAKTARVELTKQIALGEEELEYIYTVFEALTKAESPADLIEIRDELYRSGYASRMKSYNASHKQKNPTVMQFETPDGMRVLCGKNNLQNEYITHRLAEKQDYWFHAKQSHGSHVLLVTEGREPTDLDFTTAAEIAAYYSGAEGANIAVDYTLAKHVKRVPGAKPGFVIYHTNWTAYVTPNGDKIAALRKK